MAIATPGEIGGYEYKFVETPHDRFFCKICIHPCRDPYLSGCCGHNFCKSCIDNARKIAGTCPFCRDEEFSKLPNKQADREIRSLDVMCTNKERGCEWQGELCDINTHLGNSDGCQFEDIRCSNECGKMLQRQYLISHVENECPHRKVDCQYCHITGEHQFIEGEHKEQCPKLPLPCPNKCEVGNVPHEDMEAHRKECPLEMVLCEYHNVGCGEKMMRKRKREHEQEEMEEHLLLTKFKLANTEASLVSTEAKLASAETKLGKLEVLVHRLINATGSSSRLIESAHWSSHLTTMATKYDLSTQICPVILKMLLKFSEDTKRADCYYYSDPFYSDNKGYKMCLCVYPTSADDGKGTHLSAFVSLMKGPYDDKLTWPLRGKFEVKLLNQISDCEYHSMIVTYDDKTPNDIASRFTDDTGTNDGWGYPMFILNKDLHKVTPTFQYLKDDCIFLQVSKQ